MIKQLFRRVALAVFAVALVSAFVVSKTNAEDVQSGPMVGFMMSPMTERIELKPGDTHKGSFYIMNPEQNTIPVSYAIKIQSFYRDEDNQAVFEDVDGRGQIANWIKLNCADSGTLAPGASDQITYTINVPQNVPAGGQYASITAVSVPSKSDAPDSATISESVAMAHTIFAEIKGQTVRTSEITDLNVPGFLFDGDITASSKVSNTGNIHGTAQYTLEVFPLFSGEPIYTNEDEPDKKLILPDRTLVHETAWENTPAVGIFNVLYKVEFEGGSVKEIHKLVIKCPIWLLFMIVLGVICLVIYLIHRVKSSKAKSRREEATKEE